MDGTPWWFFCLVLLAGNLPTSSSSHCAPPTNALKHEVDNMTMWTCPMGHAWSDGGAVHISDCDDADEISSDLTCDQQMGVVVSLCLSALVQDIEGAKTPVDLGTNSKYLKCEDGKAWLSDRFYHLVHCEDGAWTTVEDICDEACEVPRDCAVLADMGAQTQDSFYIKPNGHPREPSVLVIA
ncbi:uncharacterized protein LOC122245154, partial [Penaeus japonicus]|uniref:uncharacterized protein LOC122245154 n=1 Tax=Penaeus japonicus TaxID=27405 RepID=UPI001C70B12B